MSPKRKRKNPARPSQPRRKRVDATPRGETEQTTTIHILLLICMLIHIKYMYTYSICGGDRMPSHLDLPPLWPISTPAISGGGCRLFVARSRLSDRHVAIRESWMLPKSKVVPIRPCLPWSAGRPSPRSPRSAERHAAARQIFGSLMGVGRKVALRSS